jgi:hypothetical protein
MVRAAECTTEAAQEVARVTEDADWTKDNATPGAPEGSPRCESEFTTPRSLKPDNVPVPVSESRRVRNSLSVFGILERLVLVVSAAAITAFIIVATPPGYWNLRRNQRTADTSSASSQFPVQAVVSATVVGPKYFEGQQQRTQISYLSTRLPAQTTPTRRPRRSQGDHRSAVECGSKDGDFHRGQQGQIKE